MVVLLCFIVDLICGKPAALDLSHVIFKASVMASSAAADAEYRNFLQPPSMFRFRIGVCPTSVWGLRSLGRACSLHLLSLYWIRDKMHHSAFILGTSLTTLYRGITVWVLVASPHYCTSCTDILLGFLLHMYLLHIISLWQVAYQTETRENCLTALKTHLFGNLLKVGLFKS